MCRLLIHIHHCVQCAAQGLDPLTHIRLGERNPYVISASPSSSSSSSSSSDQITLDGEACRALHAGTVAGDEAHLHQGRDARGQARSRGAAARLHAATAAARRPSSRTRMPRAPTTVGFSSEKKRPGGRARGSRVVRRRRRRHCSSRRSSSPMAPEGGARGAAATECAHLRGDGHKDKGKPAPGPRRAISGGGPVRRTHSDPQPQPGFRRREGRDKSVSGSNGRSNGRKSSGGGSGSGRKKRGGQQQSQS
ncbi:hypothetical protein DL771_002549 [Monosporascus sp. 5C6A]|nr:hypothetical protein DL771_002549 [Monosporascus sp. 5C6A]